MADERSRPLSHSTVSSEASPSDRPPARHRPSSQREERANVYEKAHKSVRYGRKRNGFVWKQLLSRALECQPDFIAISSMLASHIHLFSFSEIFPPLPFFIIFFPCRHFWKTFLFGNNSNNSNNNTGIAMVSEEVGGRMSLLTHMKEVIQSQGFSILKIPNIS